MNPTLSGLLTALLLILFLAICLWSWSSKRKSGFEKMANLPLEDDNIKDINEESL